MSSKFSNPALHAMHNERFKLFKSQDLENGFFDVAFSINDKVIHAHKYILGSVSAVLKNTFLLRTRLQNTDVIPIDDCSYEIFYDFLTFLYSGNCDVKEENIISFAEISDKYQVETLKRRCHDYFLNAEYSSSNFIKVFELFFEHPTFRQSFCTGMMKSYPKWLDSTNFLTAQKKTIETIVGLDRPYKYEAKLFEAVFKWAETRAKNIQESIKREMEADYDDDCIIIDPPLEETEYLNTIIKNELANILPKIRFNAMEREFVTSFVVKRGFLFEFTDLATMIKNIKTFEVEVTDFQGKKARGTLLDQNFVVDEIKKLENVHSEGYAWELSSKFKSSHFKFVAVEGEYAENIYYLFIGRRNGNLCISKYIDNDYFLSKLTAQKDFIGKDCVIKVF